MIDKDLIFCTDCKTYQYPDHDCKYAPGCPGHEDIYSGVGRLCPQCRADLELGREAREFIEQVARQKIGTDDDFPQEDYESCDWEGGFGYVVEQARRIMAKEALKGSKP